MCENAQTDMRVRMLEIFFLRFISAYFWLQINRYVHKNKFYMKYDEKDKLKGIGKKAISIRHLLHWYSQNS